jgi:hypothetical protein
MGVRGILEFVQVDVRLCDFDCLLRLGATDNRLKA